MIPRCPRCGQGPVALVGLTITAMHVLPDAQGRYALSAAARQGTDIQTEGEQYHCCDQTCRWEGTSDDLGERWVTA
jgi:hypothetical protein